MPTSLALKNAEPSYIENFASALIVFHPMCYLLFTLLFYAVVVPDCAYFAPGHQQAIITRVLN